MGICFVFFQLLYLNVNTEVSSKERVHKKYTHNSLLFQRLASAIEELEQVVSLLEVNLNEGTALEKFLLVSLRIWSSPE